MNFSQHDALGSLNNIVGYVSLPGCRVQPLFLGNNIHDICKVSPDKGLGRKRGLWTCFSVPCQNIFWGSLFSALVLLFGPLSADTDLHDRGGGCGLRSWSRKDPVYTITMAVVVCTVATAVGTAKVRFSGPLQTLYNYS